MTDDLRARITQIIEQHQPSTQHKPEAQLACGGCAYSTVYDFYTPWTPAHLADAVLAMLQLHQETDVRHDFRGTWTMTRWATNWEWAE